MLCCCRMRASPVAVISSWQLSLSEDRNMSRALIVIDVQNEYFTGALPITHPVGHLEQILKVMDAAAGRIPTVVIQHHTTDMPIFRQGSKEWELHPEVAGRPRDLLIQKTLPGSFTNTPLESWLRERGITT